MFELGEYLERKNMSDYLENVVKVEYGTSATFWNKDLDALSSYVARLPQKDSDVLTFDNPFINNSPFLSQILKEENVELPENLKLKARETASHLKIGESIQKDIEKLLQKIYTSNSEKQINISISSDNEFLIYVLVNGTYKNILINDDGDIEILVIPSDRSKSHNKMFYREDGLNFSKVVSTFNEMQ